MIDISKEIKRYNPIEPDKLPKMPDGSVSGNIEESVKLYNQAIRSLSTKSDDIAIIELRKALSLYPDFNEAKLLLSLAYIINQEYSKAEELLMEVIDSGSILPRAALYLQHITASSQSKKVEVQRKIINIKLPKLKFVGSTGIYKAIFIFFSAGVILTSLVFWAFGAFSKDSANQSGQKLTVDNALVNENSELMEDIKGLQQTVDEINTELEYLRKLRDLITIENDIESGNTNEARAMLDQLSGFSFKEVERQKYESLVQKLNEKEQASIAVNQQNPTELYNKGYSAFNTGDYSNAINYLHAYIDTGQNNTLTQYAWYLLGKSYKAINDKENAALCFNKLINDYPDSEYARYARNRLRELNRQ